MKKSLSIFTLVFLAFLTMTSCNQFKLDEHMVEASFLVNGGEYNKAEDTSRRVFLTLLVKGINEDSYTLNYTIDGNQGTGNYSLQLLDSETATNVYNWQVFTGSKYLSEEMFSGQYNGNFPSGSSTKLMFLNTGANIHPNHGSVSFLSPKLAPGNHTIVCTITNSYGDVITVSSVFVVKNKQ